MKTGLPFWRSTCRLLTLLLVLVGVGKAVFPVHGKSIINHKSRVTFDLSGLFFENQTKTKKDPIGLTTEIRLETLYNMCTKSFLRVLRKGKRGKRGMDASGRKDGKLNDLVFENAGQNTIKIWGLKTTLHICFNRRGKLITRKNGNKKLCQFIEKEDGDFFQYETAHPRYTWLLGFKKNGKPLKGGSKKHQKGGSKKHQDCYKFLKVGQEYKCDKKGKSGIKHCIIAALKIDKRGPNLMTSSMPSTPRKRHYIPKEWTG